jgi:hypothetical protein
MLTIPVMIRIVNRARLLTSILMVSGSNLGLETDYPKSVMCISLVSLSKLNDTRPRPFPSTPFSVHYQSSKSSTLSCRQNRSINYRQKLPLLTTRNTISWRYRNCPFNHCYSGWERNSLLLVPDEVYRHDFV